MVVVMGHLQHRVVDEMWDLRQREESELTPMFLALATEMMEFLIWRRANDMGKSKFRGDQEFSKRYILRIQEVMLNRPLAIWVWSAGERSKRET